MNQITGRHEWTYAGETFSVGEKAEVERAVAWDNGKPTWAPVLRAVKLSVVSIAVDACAKEIIRLSLLVDELTEMAGRTTDRP